MPAGHLAYNFSRRLIVDAFVGDIPRRRLRGTLDNDALYALVDGAARIVLVHFLAPHASQFGLRGQGIHGGGSATLLGHGLDASSLGFGNQALNSYLLVRGRCDSCLLMNGKLLFLQFSHSCSDVYPNGTDNIYAAYDGHGGVPVGGIAQRLLFAWYFNDVNLMLSSYITGDSRIMIRRDIQERVRTIAPFLRLDNDPYLVISDGRLFWMQDAYTTSNYFPYAQPVQDFDLNYIRNSVKVVIDAYNGTVDFYLMDPADPIAATYQRIFPGLFKPFAAMPPGLQKHIRYPEDLFLIQARLYQAYHMETADVL